MASIPRSYIERFTSSVNRISEQARAELAAALELVDYSQDVATIREQVITIMQAYCEGATDLAAILSAEVYDGLREYEIGSRMGASTNSGRIPEATVHAVRAFAQKLVDGKTDEFKTLCIERLDYEVKRASAETILNNGNRDRIRPRYARVPTGTETCDFCLMLASRGFVYKSLAAASHFHSNCDCRVIPSWKAFQVDGYDPDALRDEWVAAVDAKAEERSERNGTSFDVERKKIMDGYERAATNAKKRKRG